MNFLESSKQIFQNYSLYKEHCYSKIVPLHCNIDEERLAVFADHTYAKNNEISEIDESIFYCNEKFSEIDILFNCTNNTISKNCNSITTTHENYNHLKSKERKRKPAPVILISEKNGNCKSKQKINKSCNESRVNISEENLGNNYANANTVHNVEKEIPEKNSQSDCSIAVHNIGKEIRKKINKNRCFIGTHGVKRILARNPQTGVIGVYNVKKKICDCSHGAEIIKKFSLQNRRRNGYTNGLHNIRKKNNLLRNNEHPESSFIFDVQNLNQKSIAENAESGCFNGISVVSKDILKQYSQNDHLNGACVDRNELLEINPENSNFNGVQKIRNEKLDKNCENSYPNGLSAIRKYTLEEHLHDNFNSLQNIKNRCYAKETINQADYSVDNITKEVVMVDTLNFEESLCPDTVNNLDPLEASDPLSTDGTITSRASKGIKGIFLIDDPLAIVDPLSNNSTITLQFSNTVSINDLLEFADPLSTDTIIKLKSLNTVLINNPSEILHPLKRNDAATLKSSAAIKIEENTLDKIATKDPSVTANPVSIKDVIRPQMKSSSEIKIEEDTSDTASFSEDPLEVTDSLGVNDRITLQCSEGIRSERYSLDISESPNTKENYTEPSKEINSKNDTLDAACNKTSFQTVRPLDDEDNITLEFSEEFRDQKYTLDAVSINDPSETGDLFNTDERITLKSLAEIKIEPNILDPVFIRDPSATVDILNTGNPSTLKTAKIKIEKRISDAVSINHPSATFKPCGTDDTNVLKSSAEIKIEDNASDAVSINNSSSSVNPSNTDGTTLNTLAEIEIKKKSSDAVSKNVSSTAIKFDSTNDRTEFEFLENIKRKYNLLELKVLTERCKVGNNNCQRSTTKYNEKSNSIAIQCKQCMGETTNVKKYNEYRCSTCGKSNICILCMNCQRKFSTLKGLRAHALVTPDHRQNKKYLKEIESLWKVITRCQMCKKKFANSGILENHQKFCNLFKCSRCSAKFINIQLLDNHMVTQHENCPNYRCVRCRKKYLKKFNWLRHISNCYTEPLLRSCRKCHRYLETIELLEKHKKTCNPNKKKFQCLKCRKQFEEKHPYLWHMKHICENSLERT